MDFKRTDILQESLEIVQKNLQKINFPLWINADIVAGPKIVDPNEFLQMADLYVPQATVSPGFWDLSKRKINTLFVSRFYNWNWNWRLKIHSRTS